MPKGKTRKDARSDKTLRLKNKPHKKGHPKVGSKTPGGPGGGPHGGGPGGGPHGAGDRP
jgi:hypothetical protein